MKLKGWAVESRVYAEDPYRDFLPSTGRLVRYRPPGRVSEGVTVRNDTGVFEGGEISIYYDPMIAKLVTHAETRDRGERGKARGDRRLRHRGHSSQRSVLAALMQHPRWRAGKISHRLHRRGISGGFERPRHPERWRTG